MKPLAILFGWAVVAVGFLVGLAATAATVVLIWCAGYDPEHDPWAD